MEFVTVTRDAGLLTITIDRPEGHNSLNRALRLELRRAFEDAAEQCVVKHDADADADATGTGATDVGPVRAVLLKGGKKVFCTGQDLKEHLVDMNEPSAMDKVDTEYNPMVAALAAIPVPVVAAVNGAAAGAGWSLALNCDFRVAARSASFKAAFPSIGLATDCGISYLLPQLVGPAKALQLLFDDQPVSAEAALELGLVTQVADGDDADEAAEEFARRLASGPTGSYREIKAMVKDAAAMLAVADLEGGAQKRLVNSVDHREAVEAFLNKRAPKFTGR
ncbi:enoyl-CoA hydratase-related protein [Corynebacterium freneyi]|uniref:2-(1,2-epoxy-1,2-dihydrophenyl)acetyl-CoA isomerase n=1 Tax=Corynebacterium freneyi TaxID=134034 RepID=A0ABS4U5S0_9CORY|nr:enoyl-CoA hydratase-related protein [Corynebacterium freneyi]MBP2331995.1 2-(1,2-epoxy-1,2-dihydrophenyl)acetyl-CoA isomerase [Corynebacterium freneyi]QXA53756.1 enoyl-CoA hydratase/isomerase family protein [Corynebacterium freneyi]WJZ05890.1 1,2-epoxyphenylacetyl-CoA isomerase [Corynebacterium freneyi]